MSTVKQRLQYLWKARFENGHTIQQPADDKYSKHDDSAEYNPSAFRDIIDYSENSKLITLELSDNNKTISVNLNNGDFEIDGLLVRLDDDEAERKVIFYRSVEQDFIDGVPQPPRIVGYNLGYEYKGEDGKNIKRIIRIK